MSAPSNFRGVSIDEVVDSYWIFLYRNHYSAHLAKFKQRLASDQKAAEAEAIVFSFLWSAKTRPDIFENPSTGGPDFCCGPHSKPKFLVEVTSLESSAAARRSALPERITGSGGGAFGLITSTLRGVAASKAAQLANYPWARVLAITLSYDFAGLLMGRLAAVNLLVSDAVISRRFGVTSGGSTQVTDLRRAVFFRPGKIGREITPCRQSISAILLVAVSGCQADVVGILHPEPSVVFSPGLLPECPIFG